MSYGESINSTSEKVKDVCALLLAAIVLVPVAAVMFVAALAVLIFAAVEVSTKWITKRVVAVIDRGGL